MDAAIAAAEAGEYCSAVVLFESLITQPRCSQHQPSSNQPPSTLPPSQQHAVHEMLAQCLMELDELPHALHHARAAIALLPSYSPGLLTLGRAAAACGHFPEALDALSTCLSATSGDSPIHTAAQEDLAAVHAAAQRLLASQVELPGLQVQQQPARVGGLGAMVWDAGIALARWLRTEPDRWRGRRVLELGSGTGLVGIVAASCGAKVTLTDRASLLPLVELNASANAALVAAAGGILDVQKFDWAHPPPTLCAQQWDVVMGADLVYNQAGVDALCTAMQQLLRNQQPSSVPVAENEQGAKQNHVTQEGPLLSKEGPLLSTSSSLSRADQASSTRSAGPLPEVVLAHKQRHEQVDWQLLRGLQALGVGLVAAATGEGQGGRVTVYHWAPR